MDTVIDSKVESIVVQSNNTDTAVITNSAGSAVSTSTETILVDTASTTNIANTEIFNVVVELSSPTTILGGFDGIQGPPGINEEDMVYAKQTDFVTDALIYKGEAVVGSSTASAVWRIRRLVLGVDGDVSETWASGNANFDKIWDNRASLIYS